MSRPRNTGVRGMALLREGAAIARSQLVASIVTALIVAAVCGVVLGTTGQAAAAEARVIANIDRAGTRTLVVSDSNGQAGILPASVPAIRRLDGLGWVLGLGPVVDVRNAALGEAAEPVPSRVFYGPLPDAVTVTGRAPAPGEALVGSAATSSLGVDEPYTGIVGDGVDTGTVGRFNAAEPLTFLNRSILLAGPPAPMNAAMDSTVEGTSLPSDSGPSADRSDAVLREIHVTIDRIEDVERLSQAIRAVVVADDPRYVAVETPQELVELREVIASELGANARRLMLLVLSLGLVVVAITLAGAVSLRRRDFGRRRALGATRSTIVALVLVHTAAAAVPGAIVGAAAGLALLSRLAGALPTWAFTGGVCLLAIVTALVGAVPPAILAALRDPVRILRVP